MRALLLPIGLLSIIGVAVSTACSVSVVGPVPFAAYGTCDSATSYAIVTAGYCPGSSCSTYYALCDGSAFDSCACDIPSGYVTVISGGDLITDLGGGPPDCSDCDLGGGDAGGGDDGGAGEAGGDAGGD